MNKKKIRTRIGIIALMLITPIISYSDGGFNRECTSFTYYDAQPTILRKYLLVATGLKINGKTVSNMNSIKTISGLNGNEISRSSMDTLVANNFEVSQDNKSIESVYIHTYSSFNFDYISQTFSR